MGGCVPFTFSSEENSWFTKYHEKKDFGRALERYCVQLKWILH